MNGLRQCARCGVLRGAMAVYCNMCGSQLPPLTKPLDPEDIKLEMADIKKWFGGECSKEHHEFQSAVGAAYCSQCGIKIGFSRRDKILLGLFPMVN